MNLDRIPPKSIRNTDTPTKDMLESLEFFADAIGGLAWRRHRARFTGMTRTVVLYLDEDHELLDGDKQVLHDEQDGEEIEVAFSALRVAPAEGEDEITAFSNKYMLSYNVCLPITDIALMPEEFRDQLTEELAAFGGTEESNDDTDTESPANDYETTTTETITIEYSIDQAEGTVAYEQTVEYDCGEINIPGASYSSELGVLAVHEPTRDNNAEESLVEILPITQDCAENIGERILIMDDLECIISNERHRMELVGQSTDDHAMRILAILSLIGGGIRRNKYSER